MAVTEISVQIFSNDEDKNTCAVALVVKGAAARDILDRPLEKWPEAISGELADALMTVLMRHGITK